MIGFSITLPEVLFFAFLGGLILNLMPCVFPVLSIKALSLLNMSAKKQKHAVLSAVLYMAGVVFTFLVIAALLITLQQTGKEIGWGFQFQNAPVVLFLSYLLFLIGLNLSGFFDIEFRLGDFSTFNSNKQGYLKDFSTGILATLVATPCMAPFSGVALGYALTQPPTVALSVFFMLGMGLAMPYVLLALIPAFQRILPKPGAWMETFRQFLAFPMYASVIWLIWVLFRLDGEDIVLKALMGMLAIAFGLWLLKKSPKNNFGRLFILFSAFFFFMFAAGQIAFYKEKKDIVIHNVKKGSEVELLTGQWQAYTPEFLVQALEGDTPVFVDMTADWCITCKINEKTSIEIEQTRFLFKKHQVIMFKGDWTNADPDITAYLKSFNRAGVPLYVYYGAPDEENGIRPDPVVLPELLTPDMMRALF